MNKAQIKGLIATTKFASYCMGHNPPIIWRESNFEDYGIDGIIEHTIIDAEQNITATGEIQRVTIRAIHFSDGSRSRVQFLVKFLKYYKTQKNGVLLVAYDSGSDRLYSINSNEIEIKENIIWQGISIDRFTVLENNNPKNSIIKESPVQYKSNELINKLKACKAGRDEWRVYEEVCTSIIDFLFRDSFRNFKTIIQARNDNGLDIKDLVVPNRSTNPFWSEIRTDYGVRNIIFEFKNYVDPISKNQIVSTSNYLKKKAYGRFAIIFSRKGLLQPNGELEQLEQLRDSDKMIIVLNDKDLIELITYKKRGEKAEEILEMMKTELELRM